MVILITDNSMFGGYIGRLANDEKSKLTGEVLYISVELPPPFNVDATRFTGRNKEKIIEKCREEAKLIFDLENLEVIDESKE